MNWPQVGIWLLGAVAVAVSVAAALNQLHKSGFFRVFQRWCEDPLTLVQVLFILAFLGYCGWKAGSPPGWLAVTWTIAGIAMAFVGLGIVSRANRADDAVKLAETEHRFVCPSCGNSLSPDASLIFCPKCGEQLPLGLFRASK